MSFVTIALNYQECWVLFHWISKPLFSSHFRQWARLFFFRPTSSPSIIATGLASTITSDHQACILQLHLTSSHVFISCMLSACMSVTVSASQHQCMLHLHPTICHVSNNSICPLAMSLTVPPNQQSHLCSLLNLQSSSIVVMGVTIAPDYQACTNQQSRW